MSQRKTTFGFRLFSGTGLGAILDRPRKKSNRSNHLEDTDPEAAKAAHAKRRDQVRRAQRNHRERKEIYIKSLEQQLLEIRDEVTLKQEFEEASLENKILKEIMLEHKIQIPSPTQPTNNSMAEVSMVGDTASPQMLRVRMPSDSSSSTVTQVNFASGPIQAVLPQADLSSQLNQISVSSSAAVTPAVPYPDDYIITEESPQSSTTSHPSGLDSPQIGIDFVLSLERPCLDHTYHPIQAGQPHGHALTLQASLLSHAPQRGCEKSWGIPSAELDRLFELSGRLDLDGELTPVQAWNHILSHPEFVKLTPLGMEMLQSAIAQKVACYGFGAVIEQEDLLRIVDEHMSKLQY